MASRRDRKATSGSPRNRKIGRITPDGVVTEFSDGITAGSEPRDITPGPDGNLWFTERASDRIGRITPAGVVTEFSQGITPGSEPLEITAGPDGNLWFTEHTGGRIGRITPEGVVTEFSAGITPGKQTGRHHRWSRDDSMWFTEEVGRIGQLTLATAALPTALTDEASSVTQTGARLNATVNPNGASISNCHFEYGTSRAYGASVPCASLPGAGSRAVAVAASVQNLIEGTTYHVRIVTTNAGGTSYGADQAFTTATTPAPQPAAGMWVGIQAGNWGPQQYADLKGAVSAVRVDSCSSNAEFSGWAAAGINVIDDISGDGVCGPYRTGGVQAINIAAWVAGAVAQVKANPTISAVEVLNEPGGDWFWGSEAESTANEAAYASLLKAVHEAFVAEFGSARPLILASYDGGHSQEVSWGEGVWNGSDEWRHQRRRVRRRDHDAPVQLAYHRLDGSAQQRRARTRENGQARLHHRGRLEHRRSDARPNRPRTSMTSSPGHASTGYVANVTIFEYRDYTTNPDENAWGVETWGGEKKLAYTALKQATAGLPLSLE